MTLDELEPHHLADPGLADAGERVVAWARANMPVLAAIREEFERERPLAGRRIGMCLHVESKTAVLIEVLRAGGAEIVLTGSPSTTDDRVAAALARDPGIRVYALKADTFADHLAHADRVLRSDPDLLLDNGADLIATTVERWDAETTSRKVELQVGRDLQFIRINGTIVGGLAGLMIHFVGEFL